MADDGSVPRNVRIYINTRTSFGLVGAVDHVDRVRAGVALACLGHRRLHGHPPGRWEVDGVRGLFVAEVDEVGAGRSGSWQSST